MTHEQAAGCGGGHDNPGLTLDEARARILEAVAPLAETERLPLPEALHRVLAEPVTARIDVPAHTNSAMDGYALRAADIAGKGTKLRLIGDSFAGHPFDGRVGAGQCVRIMTGAVLPAGADAVVMQERTEAAGEDVVFDEVPKPGSNVREAGEDLARGDTVLSPGHWLRPADLGVLASVGTAEVAVHRRPRVAFFSTGDELQPAGTALAVGEIFDSNRYTIRAMLEELGVTLIDLGIVRDTTEALEAAFDAAAGCDAIISSGGVSVGAADYVLEVLRRRGDVGFWRVSIKPGRPLAFGRVGEAHFFGLPGNPVSVMVTFLQMVRPALVKLSGGRPAPPLRVRLPLAAPIRKKPGRAEFQRARLVDGGTAVEPLGHQGSGVLRSMSAADCFVFLEADSGDVAAGAIVAVEPFAQPVWNG